MRPVILRRGLVALFAAAVTFGAITQAQAETLRIGYQKYGTLVLLKAKGTLEKRLAAQGVDVQWTEFPGGPQLLEGLNVGSIDFGVTGETPPVFAQAAGADLLYVAYEPPAPHSEAILVPKGSPIKSVAELKGKKVVLNKGSNVHYLLVRALEDAGLKYTDIQTVFLPPADARAAFERGSVDAWVIWDPYQAAAEQQLQAQGVEVVSHQVRDFPAADLLHARFDSPEVLDLLQQIENADGLLIATPVYKASFSGALKTVLDLLPERALAHKVVLPMATGGSIAHMLAVDYALKPVLSALKADELLQGIFAVDTQIAYGEGSAAAQLAPELEQRLNESLELFFGAMARRPKPLDPNLLNDRLLSARWSI